MAVSFRSQGGEASRDSSDALLEPYEAYTDSPNTNNNVNKPSVQVHSVSQGQVGRRSRWRQSLDWIPSFSPRLNNGDDEEDLPLLSEGLQRKKRSCRSRFWRYFLRTLTAFFIMLYVALIPGPSVQFGPIRSARIWILITASKLTTHRFLGASSNSSLSPVVSSLHSSLTNTTEQPPTGLVLATNSTQTTSTTGPPTSPATSSRLAATLTMTTGAVFRSTRHSRQAALASRRTSGYSITNSTSVTPPPL